MANNRLIPDLILGAGGIVIRGNQTLIVHKARRAEWTLPRGKLKRGESPLDAALRETEEETGYKVRVEHFAGCAGYEANGIPKVVLYWRMSALGARRPIDAGEIAEARWVTLAGAKRLLSFRDEFTLLRKAWPNP